MSNLLNCPFCGATSVNHTSQPQSISIGRPEYYWVCPVCVCAGPIATTLEGATDGWNTRDNVDPEQIMRDNITTHNEPLRANMDEKAYQVGYTGGVLSMYADAGENASFAQGRKDRQVSDDPYITIEEIDKELSKSPNTKGLTNPMLQDIAHGIIASKDRQREKGDE